MKMQGSCLALAGVAAALALAVACAPAAAPAPSPPPAAPAAAPAAPTPEPFFAGKTVRVIVGFAPGGGYDSYARLIAKHIGKHIPGSPTFVVDNMPGAGSLIAANHLYKVAKPDGLTVGVFINGLILQQVIGDPAVEFDARQFNWIGAPSSDNFALVIRADRGIKTAADLLASPKEIVLGGVSQGSATDYYPKLFKQYMGAPIRLVSGYSGTATVRIAIESGEVEGYVNAWESLQATHTAALESGFVIPLMQLFPSKQAPSLPLMEELAKSPEGKQLIRLVGNTERATRFWVLPPGMPPDRVKTMREAFVASLKDPELLAEAKTAKLEITTVTGEDIEKLVKEILATPPEVVKQLGPILQP